MPKIKGNNYKHGATVSQRKTVEYAAWHNMKMRCYNPKSPLYPNYGGRGIKVCDRWLKSFTNFLDDMGNKPYKEYSLDRIDNNGNYDIGNCRWTDFVTQSLNKRSNRYFVYKNERKRLRDWAKIKGLNYNCLKRRIFVYNWDIERAFSQPSERHKP